MAYYDRIAKQWHEVTGFRGGSFKKHVLNEVLLQEMGGVNGRSILELGAGNGYFMHLAFRHFSGQKPQRIVVSDQSEALLAIAQSHLAVDGAEYLQLDVRAPFPFEDEAFDLILATMVFNEVTSGGVRRALNECHRVLRPSGRLLVTATHPDFIASLRRRDMLKRDASGILTMPGAGQLRLPIAPRSLKEYERLLATVGLTWDVMKLAATAEVVNERPGLRHVGKRPLALLLKCRKGS